MQKMYVSYVVEMPDGISERGVERVVDKVQMELHSTVGLPFKLVSVFGPVPAKPDDLHRDPEVLDTITYVPLYTHRLSLIDRLPFDNSRAALEMAACDAVIMKVSELLTATAAKIGAAKTEEEFITLFNTLNVQLQERSDEVMPK